MSFDRHLTLLEPRTLFAATDPYPVLDASLEGNFTSRVPFVVDGGESIDLKLKIRNISSEYREGTVDLTFVLLLAENGVAPKAVRGDAVLASMEKATITLKPKASAIFKAKGTIPANLDYGNYWVAAAVNSGGDVATGAAYGPTVGAAITYVGFSETSLATYNVRPSKAEDGASSAIVSGTFSNVGLSPAKGTVTLNFYASESTSKSTKDVLLTTTSLDLNLKAKRKQAFSFEVLSPASAPTLPANVYYLRVEVLLDGLPVDVNREKVTDLFSKKPIPLGR